MRNTPSHRSDRVFYYLWEEQSLGGGYGEHPSQVHHCAVQADWEHMPGDSVGI